MADAFHRDYNDDMYEQKIARLIRAARTRKRSKNADVWMDAITVLSEGDHYLAIMINQGGSAEAWHANWRSFAVVLAIGCLFILFPIVLSRYLGHDVEHDPDVVFVVWAAAGLATVTYLLLCFVFGATAVDGAINKVIGEL